MPYTRCATIAVLCGLALAGCSTSTAPQKPLPPLLAHATGNGGWLFGCPAISNNAHALTATRSPASPEITQRLRQQFPPGTAEADLTRLLADEGFDAPLACEADSSIRHAHFFQKGTGFLPYDANADVFWKVDADGRIVWAQGGIFYQGL